MKGIFGRFRGGPAPREEVGDKEVSVESIGVLISDQERTLLDGINSGLVATFNSCSELFDSIRSKGRVFLEAEVSKEIRGRTMTASQKSKDTFGRKLIELSGNFQQEEIKSFDELLEVQKAISNSLLELGELGRAYARHLVYEFPEQLRELNSEAKELGRISKEVGKTVDENKETFTNLSKVRARSRRLTDLTSEIKSNELRLTELNHHYHFLSDEGNRINDDLRRHESGQEFDQFRLVQDLIEKIKQDLAKVRDNVEQQFASMMKPLRKMRHLGSLDEGESQVIDQCLEDSWQALLTVDEALLSKVLRKLIILIERRTIEVKRESKLIHKVETLTNNISAIKTNYRSLEAKLREKEKEGESPFAVKTKVLQDASSRNQKEQDRLEIQIKEAKRVEQNLLEQIGVQIPEIEERMSEYRLGNIHIIRPIHDESEDLGQSTREP